VLSSCPGGYDTFHDLIFWDEVCSGDWPPHSATQISRCGAGGLVAALVLSMAIALPPVLASIEDGSGGRQDTQELLTEVARKTITGVLSTHP
jgi:hypothetical protein